MYIIYSSTRPGTGRPMDRNWSMAWHVNDMLSFSPSEIVAKRYVREPECHNVMTGLYRQSYPVAVEHRKLLVLWASRVDGAPLVGCEVTRHDAEELWHGAATWSLGRNNLKRPGETKTERCKTGGKNQELIKGNIRMIGHEFKATLTPCGHI